MNNGGELRKAGKRRHDKEDTTTTITTDRLTHLPEPILYHILLLLSTKLAVQTSVLSRDWNRAWKHVPVLNLHKGSFYLAHKFDSFVSKVLSLRYDLKLHKVFYYGVDRSTPKGKGSRSLQVVDYALSHDVEELVVHWSARNESFSTPACSWPWLYRNFSAIFSDYCNTNIHKNEKRKKKTSNHLRTLDLHWINIDHGFATCSGFPMLTTLSLRRCPFNSWGLILTNFPCLKNLAITPTMGSRWGAR
ncbi:unnamed protein product [Linum tenue]|uniref:F-box domain-containing protein n=1 Tax=Linum tenue TaxID=586396 RepID=A0AAV0IN60_9ROSI|nr:unnamed protein product [Linum tenue]